MTGPDWNDLRLFLAVAREGSLSAAARATGTSQATLSRRMTALEHALDRRLFERGANGYALARDGNDLFARIAPMGDVADALNETARPVVRISAGTWTLRLLSDRIGEYWRPDASWRPEFVGSDARLDIARREIDVGVRNARPEEPWLAARRVGHRDYAPYRAAGTEPDGWVCLSEPTTPTARWTRETHAERIVVTVTDPVNALGAVKAGFACMLLPTFVGDREPGLERAGGVVEELRTQQWLVTHHEQRHHPPVRAATDALAAFLDREWRE